MKPTDADWFECPFCEVLFASNRDLCEHVMNEHGNVEVNNRKLVLTLPEWRRKSMCWCGLELQPWLNFEEHIEKEGGMVAHVLKLLLLTGRVQHED